MFTPGGQLDRLSFAGVYKKGGGGGAAYTPPAPIVLTDPVTGRAYTQSVDMYGQPQGTSAQDQLNAGISQREADAKATSDATAAQAAQDKADTLNKFNTSKSTAYNDALADVMHQFQQKGVDPTPYLESDIKPMLNRTQNTIKDLDPNPGAAYGADLGTNIINSLTESKRTGYGDQLNKIFAPSYAETNIPDSLTSQYSDTLLNEQFDPLRAQLTNAQKRGTLTDVGYNAALSTLGQKLSTGQSTIGDLGKTIIGKDRGEVNDYIGNARKDANAASLSTVFDPNTYASGAQNLVNSDVANFGGALRNAVGGTKFADISELINAGGAVQGATNPSAANPNVGLGATILADDPNLKRGLGNTGAFLSIQVEPLKKCSHLLNAIVVEYYEKTVAHEFMPPLSMDWDQMAKLEAQDKFVVVTYRDHDKLHGFVTYFINPHPFHNTTIFASCGTLAVKLEHRGKGIAKKLLNAAEPLLKMYDVKMILHGYRTLYNVEPIFPKHGYTLTEQLYMKAI